MEEKLTKSERLTHYYRWQFLRLNRGYQLESDLFAEGVNKTKNNRRWSMQRKREIIEELEGKLLKKYGINGIYNHRRKRPSKKLRIYGDADFPIQIGTLKSILGDKLTQNQRIRGNYLIETLRRTRDKRLGKRKLPKSIGFVPIQKFVQIIINYDAPIGDIEREINKIIKPIQEVRQKKLGVPRPKTRSEETIEDYENYIKVWMFHSQGVRNKDIAKTLSAYDNRAAEDKANKYRQRAEALINGGYRKIRF